MIVLIDNYDSFSFNLVHYFGGLGAEVVVHRNDKIAAEDVLAAEPEAIVLSPGPCTPADAGICVELIRQLHAEVPILGICLGHQAIYEAFGGTVSYAGSIMHGKASTVTVRVDDPLFRGLPPEIQAARYHSLAAVESTLPGALRVIAWARGGEIMAVCHEKYPVYGVQFHPESILTPLGAAIIQNFTGGYQP